MTVVDHDIRVTLRDVYETQQEQVKTMAVMSAKLDLYIGINTEKQKLVTDHETRLRSMERKIYSLPGVATIIGLAGLMVAISKK